MSGSVPYWRLSGFYLFYFASLGALLPYWSLYLLNQGFSPLEIGELMAVLMATKIIAPNLWGWLGDHTGRRMGVVRLGSLLALLAFSGVFLAHSYWALAAVMFAFSFFWNAVLPQFEANTLTHLGADTHRYSIIRLWGSIGFIIAVAGLGAVLQQWGADLLPVVLLVLFAAIFLSSLTAPEQHVAHGEAGHEPFREIIRRPEVLALIVVSFLIQASHGPYYTFFTIFMEDLGYPRTLVGQLWALGVVAEVGVFLVMHRLAPRYGLRRLLLVSLLLTALRWVLTAFWADTVSVILLAQILHAASFGINHAVAIAFFHRYFSGRHHGKGQAFYSSLGFGMGGAVGAYYSGVLWETTGSASAFLVAALLVVLGWFVAWRWIPRG